MENLIHVQGFMENLNLSLDTSHPQSEFVSGTCLGFSATLVKANTHYQSYCVSNALPLWIGFFSY